jgi:hypothetical protein
MLLHDEHQLIAEMVKAQLAMADSGLLDPKPETERRQAIALRRYGSSISVRIFSALVTKYGEI